METMTTTIDPKRLERALSRKLDAGKHDDWAAGVCVMEAVAYVAREPWSDHPECVCPVIAAFARSWNDGLSDEDRNTYLRPLITRFVGTRNPALEKRRSLMAADWLVREHTVAWLRLAKLHAQADALANLPEITAMAQIPSIRGPIEAAKRDAAALAAAWAAARAAAGDAAGDAARAAAGDAAGAAAWDAARAAALAAAWAAARAAAGDALKPTQVALQQSALKLLERMIDLKEAA